MNPWLIRMCLAAAAAAVFRRTFLTLVYKAVLHVNKR